MTHLVKAKFQSNKLKTTFYDSLKMNKSDMLLKVYRFFHTFVFRYINYDCNQKYP
jgi:hypothetical protein